MIRAARELGFKGMLSTETAQDAVESADTPTDDVQSHDDHGHDSHGGHYSSLGLSNNKLAMWLFLGSECLLFGGLISTYMLYRNRHSANLGWD